MSRVKRAQILLGKFLDESQGERWSFHQEQLRRILLEQLHLGVRNARTVCAVAAATASEKVEALAEVIPSPAETLHVDPGLVHGSRTLYLPKDTKATWEVVLGFLEEHSR